MPPTNLAIAELLSRSSEEVEPVKRRAYRRAARGALTWDEEASDLVEQGRPLNELDGIGERLALRVTGWIKEPPEMPEPSPTRLGYSTMSVARLILDAHPEWRAELKGDLQAHSTYSDGSRTIAEMADAARDLGHSYIAMTDHSQGLTVAGGMSPEELRAQAREIDELNEELAGHGFRILKALEMNIDVEGEGDMEPEDLRGLELVLGSFHSKLRLTTDQTDRYIKALRNPLFHVLGHPRGRMYGRRAGLVARWEEVFEEAARTGKAVEIDCNPHRQDLNAELTALAGHAGCFISIGTDAHYIEELSFVGLGLATALAAGIPRERILNYMSADELVEWAGSR